jgi:plastocyanin
MFNKTILILALFSISAATTACGGGNTPAGSTNAPTLPSAGPAAYDPATATARVFGNIRFEGTPPVVTPVRVGGSRFCVLNARGTTQEDVLVTDQRLLRNVIVYVRSGQKTLAYSPPSEPAILDQQKCVYIPHVISLMVGQKLTVKNSDDTFHNVHGMPQVNPMFNIGQPVIGAENTLTFTKAETPFKVGCDLHGWMGAWVALFDHPFHNVARWNV